MGCRSTLVALMLGSLMTASLRAESSATWLGSSTGSIHFMQGDEEICEFRPAVFDKSWKLSFSGRSKKTAVDSIPFDLAVGKDTIEGDFRASEKDGGVDAAWTFSSENDIPCNAASILVGFDTMEYRNLRWTTDTGKSGTCPESLPADPNFFSDEAKSLSLIFPNGKTLKFDFPETTRVTLTDGRAWGGRTYNLSIHKKETLFKAHAPSAIRFTATYTDGLRYRADAPVTITAGEQWIPLKDELEIIPGSALDLSGAGFIDGPCGAKGRVIITPEGHFAFEKEPKIARRFYGANLCFNAQYLSKPQVDQLLDRLTRLGYNALRIHHYDCLLTDWKPGFDWNPTRVDQLDYLMAECAKRGIWITTDLYVTRVVSGKQIGQNADRMVGEKYKALIPVYEPAFQDWATFARKFLDRVNPYTGKRVADDPTVAWISLINENNASSYSGIWDAILTLPEWKTAWNSWLAARYTDRKKLADFLGDLTESEDPAKNTVALPPVVWADSKRARAAQIFAAELEQKSYARMRNFLRDEIKCFALLTNMNDGGSSCPPFQATRAGFDFVDEHFYVDHPVFLEKPWSLPSRAVGANPIRSGALGSFRSQCSRLYGKPFTVSEYNYAAPGRYRAVGAVLTASLGALHDWDAFWRFAYSGRFNNNDQDELFPAPAVYFDLVRDPLNQASDRLALLLFLRRDLKIAPHQLGLLLPKDALQDSSIRGGFDGFETVGWITRVCGLVTDEKTKVPDNLITIPYQAGLNRDAIQAALSNNKIPASDQLIRSETGEITLDRKNGGLTIDSPRSAGGYADAGKSIQATAAGVSVSDLTTGATVFVSSLETAPIATAKRLLVTHLTDLQNTNCLFGETARQTLLDWGTLPHLVRDGSASVRITLADPAAYTVWALSVGGRRVEKVPSKVVGKELTFTASVRGSEGARLLYEVAK